MTSENTVGCGPGPRGDLTLPPKEDPLNPGMCGICYGPLGADDRIPRSLGLCKSVGCHDRCRGCGHERWVHGPTGCLHTDSVGYYGEYNDDCVCVLSITDVPYGTHTREHYD